MAGRSRRGRTEKGTNIRSKHTDHWEPDESGDLHPSKYVNVRPDEVGMNASDIEAASFHEHYRLQVCETCGNVQERYHDEIGELQTRKIGIYDKAKHPRIFRRLSNLSESYYPSKRTGFN